MRLLLVLAIFLVGCVSTPPMKNNLREPIKQVEAPPSLDNYLSISDPNVVLELYATDMNWYIFYLFSYTKILNHYAMERGWEPPNISPICRVFAWPKSLEIPNFQYREGMTPEELDVELTIFISNAKKAYEGQVRLFDEVEIWQRRLCIY